MRVINDFTKHRYVPRSFEQMSYEIMIWNCYMRTCRNDIR